MRALKAWALSSSAAWFAIGSGIAALIGHASAGNWWGAFFALVAILGGIILWYANRPEPREVTLTITVDADQYTEALKRAAGDIPRGESR